MDELTQSLIVVAVTGALVAGLFFYLSQRKKRRQADFDAAARQRGWRVRRSEAPLESGVVVEGGVAGAGWLLEAKSTASSTSSEAGSSAVSLSTCWSSQAAALLGRAVVAGPVPGGSGNPAWIDGPLGAMAVKMLLGENAAWAGRLHPASVPGIDGLFCLAEDEADARRLFGSAASLALADLPARLRPVIKLRAEGLELSLTGQRLDDPGDIAIFTALGEALVRDWNSP